MVRLADIAGKHHIHYIHSPTFTYNMHSPKLARKHPRAHAQARTHAHHTHTHERDQFVFY